MRVQCAYSHAVVYVCICTWSHSHTPYWCVLLQEWDKPEYVPDPEAKKPEDWDDDMDGEWEPPMIPNPDYKVGGELTELTFYLKDRQKYKPMMYRVFSIECCLEALDTSKSD